MTEATPFLQKYDITFLRPPPIMPAGKAIKPMPIIIKTTAMFFTWR